MFEVLNWHNSNHKILHAYSHFWLVENFFRSFIHAWTLVRLKPIWPPCSIGMMPFKKELKRWKIYFNFLQGIIKWMLYTYYWNYYVCKGMCVLKHKHKHSVSIYMYLTQALRGELWLPDRIIRIKQIFSVVHACMNDGKYLFNPI